MVVTEAVQAVATADTHSATQTAEAIITWAKVAAGSVGGAIVLGFIGRIFQRKFVEEGVGVARASGETDIINQLRTEIERLAELNTKLAEKMEQFQAQNLNLKSEVAQLKLEVDMLKKGNCDAAV